MASERERTMGVDQYGLGSSERGGGRVVAGILVLSAAERE